MGRRPKPTELKLIENARDRRPASLRTREPQPNRGHLSRPDWFTDEQRAIWDHALANAPLALLKGIDRDLFISWVISVDLRNLAAQKLNNSPLVVRMPNGNVVLSPYQRMFNQQTANMKALAAEFGFSPAARTGIAIDEETAADPTDRFFK
jgi:P27 family predicted phage terminase small subunit